MHLFHAFDERPHAARFHARGRGAAAGRGFGGGRGAGDDPALAGQRTEPMRNLLGGGDGHVRVAADIRGDAGA